MAATCFFRRLRRYRIVVLVSLCCLSLLVVAFVWLYHHHGNDPAWNSSSLEAGLLRVMQYIENERDLDSIVRDAFIDRIWRSLKMDLVSQLVSNGVLKRPGEINDFLRKHKDVLRYALTKEGQDNWPARAAINLSYSSLHNPLKWSSDPAEFLSRPILNPFQFTYNYDQSSACSPDAVDVVIAVPSAPGNFQRRQNVRKSERAKFAKNPKNRAKLLFFIGYPDPSLGESSRTVQESIDQEQISNSDIVQATFVDTYKNITKKAAVLMDWSSKYCSKARFLIRTDDDITVNITAILSAINHTSAKLDHFIIGTTRINWKPHRRRSSKYFISFEEDPYKTHPPFLLGGVMGYPIRTAGLLLEAMRRVVLLWLDDLFLTGLCAKHIGIPIVNSSAFLFKHE